MSQKLATSAKIIPFAQPANRMRRPTDIADGQRGIVLLFTGVRYERILPAPGGDAGPDRRSHA